MLIQLNPPIPVTTPKGPAIAHFVIDYGPESDLKWICFQQTTGECWTYSNIMIRAQKNITENREFISPFYNPEEAALRKGGGWFCGACGGHNKCECEDDSDSGICDECGEYEYDCICDPCDYKELYLEKFKEIHDANQQILMLQNTNKILSSDITRLYLMIKKLSEDLHTNVAIKIKEEEIPY